MKLLYCYLNANPKSLGVLKKILAKVDKLNKLGLDTRVFFLTRHQASSFELPNHVNIIEVPKSSRRYFHQFDNHALHIQAFREVLEKEWEKGDLVMMRAIPANKWFYELVRDYPDTFILEHNSKMREELKREDHFNDLSLWRPSHFLHYFLDRRYPLAADKRFAKKVYKYARNGIAVTYEIGENERQKALPFEYKVHTVSNGLDVDSIPLKPRLGFNGHRLDLLFLRGGGVAPWYGIERLFDGIAAYKGKTNIHLWMVGKKMEVDVNLVNELGISDKVHFTGYKSGKELDEVIEKCHLGIGSLGMHRIGLSEGAVLKVKEYAGRGLPVAIAFKDVDLSFNEEFEPYVLHLPANESPIDMESLIKFVEGLQKMDRLEEEIRALASKFLDAKIKMEQLLKVIKEN
ncbi:MAG: glycosyltransferase [Bacteroidia bacterium]|nr:glycosyltransferase [Bacteroidia bacterium]